MKSNAQIILLQMIILNNAPPSPSPGYNIYVILYIMLIILNKNDKA